MKNCISIICWLVLLTAIFQSCLQRRSQDYLFCNMESLFTTDTASVRTNEVIEGGLVEQVEKKSIQTQAATLRLQQAFLLLTTQADTAWMETNPAALGFPSNWESFSEIRAVVRNLEATDQTVEIRVYGTRNYLFARKLIPAGTRQSLLLSLDELPLTNGIQPPYHTDLFRLSAYSTAFADSGRLQIEEISLKKRTVPALPVADRFGQRLQGQWTGKISSEEQLKTLAEQEPALSTPTFGPQTDRFGGWTGGPAFKATGFFRLDSAVENGQKRWWLVTPTGLPFWSFGVTGVRPRYPSTGITPYKEREFLFQELPDPAGPYQQAYDSTGISFYALNALRTWGSLDNWRSVTLARLPRWGFNTIGNWSEEALLAKAQMPYTRTFRTAEWIPDSLLIRNHLPDFFNPHWIHHVDTLLARAARWKADSLLLGYFVDNEQPWERLNLLVNAPEKAHIRQQWANMMERKYRSVEQLNQAWGTQLPNWEAVRLLRQPATEGNEAFQTDYLALETAFARQYFRTIVTTLKKYDPNHLYLGCRFTKKVKPAHIVKAAGMYSDVVTVNVYDLIPNKENMEKWHQLSGRPLLIGEHHLPLQSERQWPPRYRAFNEQEREQYFAAYVRSWASTPYALGSHWYQYTDQNLTGRGGNGENQVIGIVDITDQPHQHLIRASRIIGDSIYHWHQGKKP